MNPITLRVRHTFFATTTSVILVVSFAAVLVRAHADGPLKLEGATVIRKKETLTVKDPTDAQRKFEVAKLKIAANPQGIVTITNPTSDDGNFAVAPVKSGKTTLTIEYSVDAQTTLKGAVELVVPYKKLQIEDLGDQPVKLFLGESKPFNVFGVDVAGGAPKITQAEVVSAPPNDAVKATFSSEQLQLKALKAGSADVTLKVLGVESDPIKVQVTEGIAKIEVDDRGVVGSGQLQKTVPENETRQYKIRIVGTNGTEFKRSATPLETTVGGTDCPATVPIQAAYDDQNENVLVVTTPALVGAGCSTANRFVKLTIPKGALAEEERVTILNFAITQKAGFIRLTATKPVLTQNDRITITAEVLDRGSNLLPQQPDVNFSLRDAAKVGVWVSLVKEGNKATLVSRNPTPKEIRDANNNELVTRPSEVVIIATTRPRPDSPEIESRIVIGLAEIVGFDLLKVKLNLMDARTAADLYGKVTSDEYYVLTVRLFNNLRDQRTQEFTGNSILAYSSSIEIAVGLEKRFDNGSKSYFPYVLNKSDVSSSFPDRSGRLKTALEAREAFNAAEENAYIARKDAIPKVSTLAETRARADALTAIFRRSVDRKQREQAFADANAAIKVYQQALVDAIAALKKASEAQEEVIRLRDLIARFAVASQDISQFSSADTAINDGKWHVVSPRDLLRLGPEPVPPSDLSAAAGDLQLLTDADLNAPPTAASAAAGAQSLSADVDQDPPCVGAITYRPFTFEMMVNTVDRRDNRSFRSKVFKVLDLIGTGTSFVTSVAVPGPSSDLPLGLEKYRNLLLPGLDKLYPNYKEQQRQNIVSQAMKEIEEIPFGSDITRIIFIPKKNIHGLVRGHDVRISEVCPYFFRIQVAIVSKNATVERGVIR